MTSNDARLFVGIPAAGPPTWGLLDSLMLLVGPGESFTYKVIRGLGVDLARNLLVKRFLESESSHLLFLDADAWIHPMTAMRLLAGEFPIVGALAFGGSKPTTPTVYGAWTGNLQASVDVDGTRKWIQDNEELHINGPALMRDRPPGAAVQVAATGAHCLMIRRSVLETMEPPWFKSNPEAGRGRGEDLYFCHKAGLYGYQVVVDRSVVAAHVVGEVAIGCLDFLAWDRFTNWESREPIIKEEA